jgi:hypothetical protein
MRDEIARLTSSDSTYRALDFLKDLYIMKLNETNESCLPKGCAIAQAVSHWLPTEVTRV